MNVDDFNKLGLKELVKLPGIGKGTANRIIAYRSKYTFYTSENLLKIKGIGLNTLKKLGIDPPAKKRTKSRAKLIEELVYTPIDMPRQQSMADISHNSRIAFYEDLVKDTCHRVDLVRSDRGCIKCPYVLLCKCHLRNFVSERGKRNNSPTKKVSQEIFDNIGGYHYFKLPDGSVNLSKVNLNLND